MSGASPTLRFKFQVRRQRRIEIQEPPATPPGDPAPPPVPRIARLVALAHKFQGMINAGTVESMADIAALGHVTRARVTQIMDLLLLAPDIQEALLFLPGAASGHDPIHLRELRYVCQTPIWAEQRLRWAELAQTFPTEGEKAVVMPAAAGDKGGTRGPYTVPHGPTPKANGVRDAAREDRRDEPCPHRAAGRRFPTRGSGAVTPPLEG